MSAPAWSALPPSPGTSINRLSCRAPCSALRDRAPRCPRSRRAAPAPAAPSSPLVAPPAGLAARRRRRRVAPDAGAADALDHRVRGRVAQVEDRLALLVGPLGRRDRLEADVARVVRVDAHERVDEGEDVVTGQTGVDRQVLQDLIGDRVRGERVVRRPLARPVSRGVVTKSCWRAMRSMSGIASPDTHWSFVEL